MGLFDSYFDPEQFQDSGGLLGRLLSLQGQQDQYQPGAGFDGQGSAYGQPAVAPQTPVFPAVALPASTNVAPATIAPQPPDYGQTQDIAIGNYQMPQFGRADIAQAAPPAPDLGDRLNAGLQGWAHTPAGNPFAAIANGIAGFNAGRRTDAGSSTPTQTLLQASTPSPDLGDRLSAGFQSWAHTPVGNPLAAIANGIAGLNSGQRADTAGIAPRNLQPVASDSANTPDLNARYQALRPVLGDRNAMLAIVHPLVGQALIAQALSGQTAPGTAIDAGSPRNGQSGMGDQTNSMPAGQPPGLTRAGYLESPVIANAALGELMSIRDAREEDTVTGEKFITGVKDGNITRNGGESLDVRNGTIITLSRDDHAKVITVTDPHIAHIDQKTGEVTIQNDL